jgi:thiosulfate reductase cytochrome b subunit
MSDLVIQSETQANIGHARWVRVLHWVTAGSLLTLAFTGFVILMAHPRLYWGEVGNDLTPALIELPISRNHKHGGWQKRTTFYLTPSSPITANRTYEIFNQNGWGRSLHFLSAWLLIVPGFGYLLAGVLTRHFRRHIWPRGPDLAPGAVYRDLIAHLRFRIPRGTGGPQYGVLQKLAYSGVIFVVVPLALLTGLTMSPAVTAAYPFLLTLFGGFQSARTIHFFASLALVLFVLAHVVMVAMSGFKRQMRAMILGK